MSEGAIVASAYIRLRKQHVQQRRWHEYVRDLVFFDGVEDCTRLGRRHGDVASTTGEVQAAHDAGGMRHWSNYEVSGTLVVRKMAHYVGHHRCHGLMGHHHSLW